MPLSTMPLHFNPFGLFVYLLFSNLFRVLKCHCISPLLVHLCIYSFHIYSRSLNAIAFHPLLFAFLLFSHLRLTRWRMAAPSWDSESMLMFKTSRFPRCVLVHFFPSYFLFVKASCWYRPAGVEACWGMGPEESLQKYFYENIKLLSATVMSPKKTKWWSCF